MDDEDTGEFGIAPIGIRATSDFSNHNERGIKRGRPRIDDNGPIPGTPVLKELLKPVTYVFLSSYDYIVYTFVSFISLEYFFSNQLLIIYFSYLIATLLE